MKLDWYRGAATADEKQERAELVKSAKPTLDILKKILQTYVEEATSELISKTNYELPAYAEHQADCIGRIRTLNTVISLLTLDREPK